MKRLLTILFVLLTLSGFSQYVTTPAVVEDTTKLKAYNGTSGIILVTDSAYQGIYFRCSPCTVDHNKVFQGVGSRKWRRSVQPDVYEAANANQGEWGTFTGELSDQTDLVDTLDVYTDSIAAHRTAIDGKQGINAMLSAILGLSPANNDIIQWKSGAPTNRTPAQLKTDLSLSKSDFGLGNVDNTSDADKPLSTDATTALNTKPTLVTISDLRDGDIIAGMMYQTPDGRLWRVDESDNSSSDNGGTILVNGSTRVKSIIEDGRVDVRWFGAVGDAVYINTADGNAYKDQGFTQLATDNTQAFKDAFDFVLTTNASMLYRTSGVNTGWRSQRYRLFIPNGAFFVNESRVFSTERVTLSGTQSGFIVEGSGVKNSYIVYKDDGSETADYLFSDSNDLPDMSFRDFTVNCTQGTEKVFYCYSTGNSQNQTYRNVEIKNAYRGWGFYGTGNADKTQFERCQYYSLVPGNVMWECNNVQSIGHSFNICNFDVGGDGSIMFNTLAGGLSSVFGGSMIAEKGATMYRANAGVAAGSAISNYNVNYSTYSTKIEVHDSAVWIDIDVASVVINNEKTRFPSNAGNNKIIIRKSGKVVLNSVQFQDTAAIGFEIDNATYIKDTKPLVIFEKCILPDGYPYNHVTQYSDIDALTVANFSNSLGMGRVIVRGSTSGSSSVTNKLNDGAPNATAGWSSTTYEKRYAFLQWSASGIAGLPNLAGTSTITIPKNCVIVRIGIVKDGNSQSGAQAAQTWKVKDGDDVDLVTLTTSTANEVKNVFSNELWLKASTDNKRTLTLYSDSGNSNHYAQGYVVIEYL